MSERVVGKGARQPGRCNDFICVPLFLGVLLMVVVLFFTWVGNGASRAERASAMSYAQRYLKRYGRPPVLPITSLKEGRELARFKAFFSPPEESSCIVM